MVCRPLITSVGRGQRADRAADADVADGAGAAHAVGAAVGVGLGAAGARRDVDQRVVRDGHHGLLLDDLADRAGAQLLGVRVLEVERLDAVGHQLHAVDVAAVAEVGELVVRARLRGAGGLRAVRRGAAGESQAGCEAEATLRRGSSCSPVVRARVSLPRSWGADQGPIPADRRVAPSAFNGR